MSSEMAVSFLDAVAGYSRSASNSSADRPIRLAVIDSAYDAFENYPDPPSLPRVTFDGESTLSLKRYPYANGYVPMAGDRVVMLPVGTTYWISARVENSGLQGFYADPLDDRWGVELGGGHYLEVDNGDLSVDGHSIHPNVGGVDGYATTSPAVDQVVSDTYVNLGGNGHSFSFTKRENGTRLLVESDHTFYTSAISAGVEFGVQINGADYKVCHLSATLTAGAHLPISGRKLISGIPAGAYTVQGRWRRFNATGTITRDNLDWSSTTCTEVS